MTNNTNTHINQKRREANRSNTKICSPLENIEDIFVKTTPTPQKPSNEMVKPKTQKKRRAYPPKHRKHLAQKARESKPWEHTTGPKTAAGKAASSQNALKHGLHSAEILKLRKLLRQQAAYLKILGA